MAVSIRIKFPGLTQEQFDQLQRQVDPDSNPPAELLFHASGPMMGGWGVQDFWESREAFDRFLEERIRPALEASGVQLHEPPEIKEFQVYEHFPR